MSEDMGRGVNEREIVIDYDMDCKHRCYPKDLNKASMIIENLLVIAKLTRSVLYIRMLLVDSCDFDYREHLKGMMEKIQCQNAFVEIVECGVKSTLISNEGDSSTSEKMMTEEMFACFFEGDFEISAPCDLCDKVIIQGNDLINNDCFYLARKLDKYPFDVVCEKKNNIEVRRMIKEYGVSNFLRWERRIIRWTGKAIGSNPELCLILSILTKELAGKTPETKLSARAKALLKKRERCLGKIEEESVRKYFPCAPREDTDVSGLDEKNDVIDSLVFDTLRKIWSKAMVIINK